MAAKDPLGRVLYSDIDMSFKLVDGDIQFLVNEDAVRQAVRNIVLTARTEKLFDPLFGTNVPSLLFGQEGDLGTNFRIERQILFAINNREPRVENVQVQVFERPDNHQIVINVFYKIVGLNFTEELQVAFERVR